MFENNLGGLTVCILVNTMQGMPLLIDGHNLIPKIRGLHLSETDDEIRLLVMLQEYSRLRRRQIECFFDHAPAGQPRVQRYGTVVAKFARPGFSADQDIQGRLQRLGKNARNWTVVSSDQSVRTAARAARAKVVLSEVFAQDLHLTLESSPQGEKSAIPELSKDEVYMWLELFKDRSKGNKPK